MISFGQRLKLIRKEAQITQGELAEQLMVSVQSVSKWECDTTMPDISQIVPLAKILGVTTDCLLGVGGDEKKDREKLDETIGRINHTYIYLTYEDNCGFKKYEQYHDYLKKYPLDYEVKLNCAMSIYDFIECSRDNTIYKIPDEERLELFNEGVKLLGTVINQDSDLSRKICASELLVKFYVLNKDPEKAEALAVNLPEQDNLKIKSLIDIYDAKKDYDKCLRMAEFVQINATNTYLWALKDKARRISIFGNVRKKEAIEAWRIYEEAARYNHKLLCDIQMDRTERFMDDRTTFWHVLRALWHRSNDCIAISDLDGALSAVEDMKDFGIEYYNFRKEQGVDKAQIDELIAWIQNSIKRCYMYSLGTPDNILDREPRFKACQEAISRLG